jgi:hypothetical protein
MSTITININGSDESKNFANITDVKTLRGDVDDIFRMMGHETNPFPKKGIDGFLSHFIITVQMLQGEIAGQVFTLNMPSAMQTVSRSEPFIYKGSSHNHEIDLELPPDSQLPNKIKESDFLNKPSGFFDEGMETVWMQILNLDARMEDTPIGPIRIILGETVKREYPDIFQPSLGVAQALSVEGGFPAKLFFNPYAIIETRYGNMRAIHGNLSYGRTVEFPPIGTPISICEMIPLEPVDDVRKMSAFKAVDRKIEPVARIIALAHPIDTSIMLSGAEAHAMIENMIASKFSTGDK